jgi:hypothetical protein
VITEDINALIDAANLDDADERRMLADALEEAGLECFANKVRSAASGFVARMSMRDMRIDMRYDERAAKKVAALVPEDEVWTRERAARERGYDARLAAQLLGERPRSRVVIISREAPTKQGLKIVHDRSYDGGSVLYYRKSAGARLGHTGRCAQMHQVIARPKK